MLYSQVQVLGQISGNHFLRRDICRSRVTCLPGKNTQCKQRSADLHRAQSTASMIYASSSRTGPGEVLHGHMLQPPQCQLGTSLWQTLWAHTVLPEMAGSLWGAGSAPSRRAASSHSPCHGRSVTAEGAVGGQVLIKASQGRGLNV